MKLTYPICCGVDVHKTFLVATIIKTDGLVPKYQKKRYSTFSRDLLLFKQWLFDNDCKDVCMESTGKYWVPVWNILEDSIHVVVANPKWVCAVKGSKDDSKDSKWIGDLFRMGMVPGSFIPDKKIRVLREFTRYRYKLISMRSGEKNRFQNAFTVCNSTLDAVLSDMFGKSASAIQNYLLETDTVNPVHCASMLQGSAKKKHEEVMAAVEGFKMSVEQKERVRIIQEHFADIDARVARLNFEIDKIVSGYESQISLLCTIPGVERNLAITIISEISTDMSEFGSSKRLCRWAGLTPGNNESAGKKKSVRITRAGVYLKPALVQAAHAAVKSTKSVYYKTKYEQIAKRRGKKRAIIAFARMILSAVFAMLKTGEVFNPSDLQKYDMPEQLKHKQLVSSAKEAVKLLVSLGVLQKDSVSLAALAG